MVAVKKNILVAIITLTIFLVVGFICKKFGIIDSISSMIFPATMVYIIYLYQNRKGK